VRTQAAQLFPLPAAKNNEPLPSIGALLRRRGDAARGKAIFATTGTCATCHVVNGEGKDVGPNLSDIGNKLSRDAFFQSILFPSAAISHNYESYVIQTADGEVVTGLLVSRTPEAVSIRGADAIVRTFKTEEIDAIAKQEVSLMAADLQKVMTAQDLVDVVQYLTTLRQPSK
ncbi:MAG: c-type cytochrome, partial [Armatimonadetes bacterium]|nr:c-type cytochrome [Armatimonadota bacterium]